MAAASRRRFNYAVFCTADIPIRVINDFLVETQAYSSSRGSHMYSLIVLDSLATKYEDASETPITPLPVPSPFLNDSPRQCSQKLRKNVEEHGSDVSLRFFVIMDERTLRDSSVVFVEASTIEDRVETFRMEPKIASMLLLSRNVGFGLMSEDQGIASKAPDGVMRWD